MYTFLLYTKVWADFNDLRYMRFANYLSSVRKDICSQPDKNVFIARRFNSEESESMIDKLGQFRVFQMDAPIHTGLLQFPDRETRDFPRRGGRQLCLRGETCYCRSRDKIVLVVGMNTGTVYLLFVCV